jgi:outer membrane biogenesis lipoprotein LolB
MKYLLILTALAIFSLTGCTDDGSVDKAKQKEETVFDGQLNALDKTREIENVLQQRANERGEQLEIQ